MKKVFITLGVLILVVITALMVIPTFFKGDILQIIEKQSAKYINAKLKIGDMNLSMFKSFPNLNVALKEVMITGQDEFAGDTVVYIPLFEASVNLKSLIAGDELIVNQLLLKNCRIAPTVNSEGKPTGISYYLPIRKLPPLRKLRPTNRKARRREAFV